METYLTIDELAGYLKLSEQTIRRWVSNREIPYRKIKKAVRFRITEVDKWIEDGSYKLPEEPDAAGGLLLDDTISLDELAEMEEAGEHAEEIT
jgi:excisionase family DNA binding protein